MYDKIKMIYSAALFAVACTATASDVGTPPTIPDKIVALIESTTPGARVVQPNEFDLAPCKPMGPSLSAIKADLTGSHRDDFAVLVKTKTGKKVSWNGKALTEAQFVLMVFIDDGHGGYQVKKLTSFTDYLPLSVNLQLEPAGKLHDVISSQDVIIEHPAISLAFCEKSATAYYLHGNQVRAIPLIE